MHFQSAIGDSNGDEADENEEGDAPPVSSNGCCREQLLEIKALRKRLEKAHRHLNIACECYSFRFSVVRRQPAYMFCLDPHPNSIYLLWLVTLKASHYFCCTMQHILK